MASRSGWAVSALVALVAAGCAPFEVDLTPAGETVVIAKGADAQVCQPLDVVSSSIEDNLQTRAHNRALAENQLRNDAGKLGATHVVLTVEEVGVTRFFIGHCNNCVHLEGQAWRCPRP